MEFKYTIKILKGSLTFVIQELHEKYPNIVILKQNPTEIQIDTDISDIESFRNLYSPLSIQNENRNIDLSKRDWRKSYIPAGINPSLAYIMCQIAHLSPSNIIYDPFCGASTLPITAIKYFNVKRVICSDISGNAIEKSKSNFKEAGIPEDRYILLRSDIKDIKLNKQNVDRIISNLPFGIRVGNHNDNILAYDNLEKLSNLLLRKKGYLIVLTQEKVLLRNTFKKDKWIVKSIGQIDEGGLLPEIFEIKRKLL